MNFGFEEARILYEAPGRAEPAFKVALHLLEQGLERFEIKALFPARDFLGLALLGAGAHVAQSVMSDEPAAPSSSASSSSSSIESAGATDAAGAPVSNP